MPLHPLPCETKIFLKSIGYSVGVLQETTKKKSHASPSAKKQKKNKVVYCLPGHQNYLFLLELGGSSS